MPEPAQRRHRALPRLTVAAGLAASTLVLLPRSSSGATRAIAAWDVFATVLAGIAWWHILRATSHATREQAAIDDPGRTPVWLGVLAASGVSLLSVANLLRGGAEPGAPPLFPTLAAVALSWFLTHTAFTLRYAHLYYRDQGAPGGLEFPGESQPSELDFAYFSFTLGMCYQVSDVAIKERHLRGTALAHSLLSFAYNTVLLALAMNLVAGAFTR